MMAVGLGPQLSHDTVTSSTITTTYVPSYNNQLSVITPASVDLRDYRCLSPTLPPYPITHGSISSMTLLTIASQQVNRYCHTLTTIQQFLIQPIYFDGQTESQRQLIAVAVL